MIRRHLEPVAISPPLSEGGHCWVGYYDHIPYAADNTRVLAHRAAFADRFPSPDDRCELGLLETAGDEPAFRPIAESGAWNWQQGSLLRFRDGSRTEVIYNDRHRLHPERVQTVIASIAGEEHARIDGPFTCVTPDGAAALAPSIGRLNATRREYGFPGMTDDHPDDPAPAHDGVWRTDLNTHERTLIVPFADLALGDAASGREPVAYVNHLMLNPSGTRFCFLHRFEREDGITQSRLFTASARDGSGLRLVMSGMISHYHWRDDNTILAWAGLRKLLGSGAASTPSLKTRALTAARKTLKPVYYAMGKPRFLMNRVMKDAYMLIPDVEDAAGKGLVTRFADGELTCDGHCTYNRAGDPASNTTPGRWVVTDGYPDRGHQPLFLWDTHAGTGYEIGRFPWNPALDGEVRVDLHPRFNLDATRVCFDSAMEGPRRVYEVDITPITNNAPAADPDRRNSPAETTA